MCGEAIKQGAPRPAEILEMISPWKIGLIAGVARGKHWQPGGRRVAEQHDGGTMAMWGDERQTRPFLNVDAGVEVAQRLMSGPSPGPVNFGSEKMVTYA